MLTVERERPDQPDVHALLDEGDARSAALYPTESRFGLAVPALLQQQVRFFVVRLDGRAVGCGGFALAPDYHAELKRMFVTAGTRGRGIGRSLLLAIEDAARAEQVRCMQLETGVKSHEALGLYRSAGYVARGPFGSYPPDPLCVFMEKQL